MQNQEIKSLEALMGGAVSERFASATRELWCNVLDPNTDPTKVRTLSLQLKVKPTKDRKFATMSLDVSTKLAPPASVETSIIIGADEQGVITAYESVEGVEPGQIDVDGNTHIPTVVQFHK